jgi:hypothetical protein
VPIHLLEPRRPPVGQRPDAPSRLDISHPLAKQLAYALLDPASGLDHVSGLLSGTRTGTRLGGSLPAGLMRGFGSTVGVGATDAVMTQFSGQATQRTWAAWCRIDGNGGGGAAVLTGRLLAAETTGNAEFIAVRPGTSRLAYVRGFTTTAGRWGMPLPTLGQTVLITVSYDAAATTNDPLWYLDGLPATVTEEATPVGTAINLTDAYYLGNRFDGLRNWDGLIGPVLAWNRLLGAGEVWSLFDPRTRWAIWQRPSTTVYFSIGATYPLTLDGAATPAGVLVNAAGVPLAGASTPSGVMLNASSRVVDGATTPAGVLATVRTAILALSGQTSPVGALVRSLARLVTGVVASAGAVTNSQAQLLTGGATPAGAVIALKVFIRELAGEASPSGTLVSVVTKLLSAATTPVGALVASMQRLLAGSTTPDGAVTAVRTVLQTLVGATTPGGDLTRSLDRTVTGVVAPVGLLARSLWRTLAGLVASVGELFTFGGVESVELVEDTVYIKRVVSSTAWLVREVTGTAFVARVVDVGVER